MRSSLESEAIFILRETAAAAARPVLLFSAGKDSAVLVHLARKAFHPAPVPFPLLHIDTTWKFRELIRFRDDTARAFGLTLLTHTNGAGAAAGVTPFTHASAEYTRIMKTDALKDALTAGGFDAAIGGARRDEEPSRAKERVCSFRTADHQWDPRRQRPELWHQYNARVHPGESVRVFPLSNWTERDVWQYIRDHRIAVPSLYFSAPRPVVRRHGHWLLVDDARMPLAPGEAPTFRAVRFRTLGCYPLTAAIDSPAADVDAILEELLAESYSERHGRLIDRDEPGGLEAKKREGYF